MLESPLPEPSIRPLTPADMIDLIALLRVSDLPLAGLDAAQLWGLEGDGGLLGVVGYERYGEVALLRSLAIAPDVRGQGYGRILMAFVLEQAKAEGIGKVYGLTTSIPEWLLKLGFSEMSRDDLPAMLYASEELRGACPASARAFVKRLVEC